MTISADRFKDARNAAGLTQQQVADALNVGLRTVGYWERPGGKVPARAEKRVFELLPDLGDAETLRHFAPGGELEKHARSMLGSPILVGAPRKHVEAVMEAARAFKNTESADIKGLLLAIFSDADLLEELLERSMERGSSLADWTADRVSGSASRQKEVAAVLERVKREIADPWDLPDYSEGSQEDHALAAYVGDKKIPFDADPED